MGDANYVAQVIRTLSAGDHHSAPIDLTISPTYVPDLVDASLDLIIDGEKGIWHITNERAVTWADFAVEIASRAHLDRGKIQGCAHGDLRWTAARPSYSALRSERASLLPTLDDAWIGTSAKGRWPRQAMLPSHPIAFVRCQRRGANLFQRHLRRAVRVQQSVTS